MTDESITTQENRVAVAVAVPPDVVPEIEFIPGLTLHLPMNKKELQGRLHGSLFTLFESCTRSKLKLKVHSLFDEERTQWVVFLFIEDKFITKGISSSYEKLKLQSHDSPMHRKCISEAKFSAANKAMNLLKKCPQRRNTRYESFLRPGETVPGLKLYLDDPCPQRDDCLALLTESCHKCNLPVTWWDDEGCKVFQSSCITVLLINSKPICYAWGDTLEDSKKETAAEAISWLKIRHEVVSRRIDGVLSCSTSTALTVPGLTLHLPIVGRDHDASVTIKRSVSQSQLSLKFNDMGIVKENGTDVHATNLVIGDTIVAWGYGKDAESSRNNISWQAVLESLLETQQITRGGPNFETTNTVVPGLTMYVRQEDKDAAATIDRSVSRSKLHKKLKNVNSLMRNGKLLIVTDLFIGNTVVARGFGDTEKSSRKNISWKGVLDSLLKTQPVDKSFQSGPPPQGNTKSKKAKRKRKRHTSPNLLSKKVACIDGKDAALDEVDEGNECGESYIVCSEWSGEEGVAAETMFDCNEVIKRYMECL